MLSANGISRTLLIMHSHSIYVLKQNIFRDLIETTPITPMVDIKMASQEDLPNYNRKNSNVCHLTCPQPTIYFRDGIRSVDFVLVWDSFEEEATTMEAKASRKIFEENLKKEGLELEYEETLNNGLNFIKVSLIFPL